MIYKIKIFNIFTNSNLEITNLNKLKEYIDFCYDNSINERIIGKLHITIFYLEQKICHFLSIRI